MKRLSFLPSVVFILLLWVCAGCNLQNPAEPIPAYLKLNAPVVLYGNNPVSENITNTWLYRGVEPLGVFNRTATVPVIGEGTTQILCFAGIMENGVAAYRLVYPFYRADTIVANLSPNADIQINPQYRYFESVEIPLNETFEAGTQFEPITPTAMIDTVSGSNAFEGSSGTVTLNAAASVFEYRTIESFPLSSQDNSIYLELDYKTEVTLRVGLFQVSSGVTYYGWNLSPKNQWNKVYFNLMDAVRSSGGGAYKIVLKAEKPADVSSATFFLDNVKLLHF